ncbi:hypothetical protein BASA81_015430 [Batrachochytrium salamandrivorans]|nr:hypothetical protein BASA81_015430 [Batrachochytrium salamandrivorans]
MQWVPSCDTLHELIKEYREARKIPVNIEHRVISDFAPAYETLVPIQKVEVFQHSLRETSGQDLAKVLWLKSANSETWLDRRTTFTRSLAAMSIVGYVLGLGDRHPSNLMCERASGRVLHIDFGDCFEVAIHRDKYPETVPFRLTRQLVNAMEVSGVEGNYRITCENVMRVLRVNRESILTMLSAFVDDPLITWRLLKDNTSTSNGAGEPVAASTNDGGPSSRRKTSGNFSGLHSTTTSNALGGGSGGGAYIGSYVAPKSQFSTGGGAARSEGDSNAKAVEVIARVKAKLRGTDFDAKVQLDVKDQVDRLIRQAQSHENLATMYVGWSAVW